MGMTDSHREADVGLDCSGTAVTSYRHGDPKAEPGPCRSCHSPECRTVLDLGSQPVADHLVDSDPGPVSEPRYPLDLQVCEQCWLLQLRAVPGAEEMVGHQHSSGSVSETMAVHDSDWASEAVDRLALTDHHLVVDVASGDGSLLVAFVERGTSVLGIERSADLAARARIRGIPTLAEPSAISARFSPGATQGADLVIGNHNLAHAPDLDDAVDAMASLLAPSGTMAIEFHHALRLVADSQFDIVCHPHRSYLSVVALSALFRRHDLEVVHADEVEVHGGSVRLYVTRRVDCRRVSPSVDRVIHAERDAELDEPTGYAQLSQRADKVKRGLLDFLAAARGEGRSVAGYGAPGRASTLLNYSGITPELLPFTVDISPVKQNRLLPGCRIPIGAPSRIMEQRPDFVLVFPWPLAEEIMGQMAEVRTWGGRFVVAVPELKVLP